MNNRDLLHRHWRIPFVGVLAGILAFAASYVISPTYESSTRLLVHGRDATFLSSTGQDLSSAPVVDASLSQALLSTYAGIATSRTVAVAVVGELKLDKQPAKYGPYAAVAQGLAWVYRCGRAFLVSGFCAKVDPYERAVIGVQQGTSAKPTGTNDGTGSGQAGSYVLEVQSSGSTPDQARTTTEAVANQLVRLSNERFKKDAEKNVASLQEQADRAQAELGTRTKAVADFQTKHGISTADSKQVLTATTLEDVRANLIKAKADLADTQAQLASLEHSIAQVPKDQQSRQKIITGRSTTETSTEGANSVYNDLLTQLNTLKAQEAGDTARIRRLSTQIQNAKPLAQNGPLAELAVLQQRADLASENLKNLTSSMQKAQTTAAQGSVDLSRLDEASQPSYPAKPKRYIYLALGLLIGALAGAALTAQAERKRSAALVTEEAGDADPDLTQAAAVNGHHVTTVDDDGLEGIFAASSASAKPGESQPGQSSSPWSPQ